jgi:hypothetical protein
MTIEDRINLAKDLIKKREEIDHQLAELFNGGEAVTKRTVKCSICGGEGHTARTCNKEKPAAAPEPSVSPKPAPFMPL